MDTLIRSLVDINEADNEAATNNKNESGNWKYFGNLTRYVVLTISTLCLSFVLGNALAFNFTVICMTKSTVDSQSDYGHNLPNFTNVNRNELLKQEPIFSTRERNWIFSAVPAGALVGTLPISHLTSTFGVRKMFFAYGILSSVATLLVPVFVYQSFWLLLIVRTLQGIATSTSYVAMGAISAEWSPLGDLGMYLCLISCHFQLAPLMVMPLAGALCESKWGWGSLYYLLGSLSSIAFYLFYWFYRDSPRSQKNVSIKELVKIEEGKLIKGEKNAVKTKEKLKTQRLAREKPPYNAMITDLTVWGILAANVGATFGNQIFWQFGPVYLHKALGMSIEKTGFAAALPYMLSGVMKLVAGPLSDRMSCVSQKFRIILFSSLSQYIGSFAFLMLVFLSSTQPTLTQLCFTTVTAFTGIWTVGVCKSAQLISAQFSHVIFSINTFVSNIVILLVPSIVTLLVPTGAIDEWSTIFIMIGTIQAVAQTFFNLTAKVKPREWAISRNTPLFQ